VDGTLEKHKTMLVVLPPKLYLMIKALTHKAQPRELLGQSPLSLKQPILFTLGQVSFGSRGVSLVGFLKTSNEAQCEMRVVLVKHCFLVFLENKRDDERK
jgi:hypothetical protein